MGTWRSAAVLAARALAPCTTGAAAQAVAYAGASTPAPPAFSTFCRSQPGECARAGANVARMALTPARLAELKAVNAAVNGSVREVDDTVQHGVEDHWSLAASGSGDCEDFALLKRKMLIARGWPSSVLLMTTVSTPSGEGHAVLTVVTDRGDLVLDNKTGAVLPWSGTGYVFYTRQSQANPRAWVWIDPEPMAIAADRARRRTTLAQ